MELLAGFFLIVGVTLFVVMLKRVGLGSIVDLLKSASPLYIALYLFVSFFTGLLLTLRWRAILNCLGCTLPLPKLFGYRAAGFAVSYVTPTARLAGEPLKAFLLSNERIPAKKAYASLVLDKLFDISVGAASGAVAVIAFLVGAGFPLKITIVAFTIITLVLLLFVGVYHRLLDREGLFSKMLEIVGLTRIKPIQKLDAILKNIEWYDEKVLHKKHIMQFLLLSTAIWLLVIAEFKIATLIIGYNASFFQLLLIYLFFGVLAAMPIPASLGTLEAGQVSAFTILKANTVFGLAISFVIRFKDIMWVLLGLIFLSRYELSLFHLFKRTLIKNKINN